MAEGKLNKRGIAFIISIIIILSGIAVIVYAQLNEQLIYVRVVDTNGNPIYNATIQGMMLTPPSNGSIFQTVFLTQTEHNGNAVVSNFTLLKRISNEWLRYYHGNFSKASYLPELILFVTYKFNGSLYFKEGSISLTPKDILNGMSGKAVVVVKHDKSEHLVNETNVTTSVQLNSLENKIQNNIGILLRNITFPEPYFYWVMQNNTFYPSKPGHLAQIPIAWATFAGSAYGEIVTQIGVFPASYAGLVLNPFSSKNLEFNTGGSVLTVEYSGIVKSALVFLGDKTLNRFSVGSSGYIYIMGQIELATYQLYYIPSEVGMPEPLNDYMAEAAIVSISTSNNQVILGNGTGIPSVFSKLSNYTNYQFYNASSGTGSAPNSQIFSGEIYQSFENYGLLVQAVIPIGEILAAEAEPETEILGIASSIVGAILGFFVWQSYSGAMFTTIAYCAAPGQIVDAYVLYSDVSYQINGQGSIELPMMGAYIYTTSSSGGGGEGCVVYETNITLSNGEQIPVQDLKVGMKTLSYDPNTGELITTTVSQIKVLNSSYIMIINGNIEVTGLNIQPIFVKFENGSVGWTMIGNLNYTMQIYCPLNNTWVPVTSLKIIFGNFTVYDIMTARQISGGYVYSDYIANGYLLDSKPTPI